MSLWLSSTPAAEQSTGRGDAQRLAELHLTTERAKALRLVKNLQYRFAAYAQYGLWQDMASLFADDAELRLGEQTIRGREAIETWLRTQGGGHDGLLPGQLNTELFMAPVVTLAADGESARGRWQQLTMRGIRGSEAQWSGGLQVNDYVREGGIWKFAVMNVYQQFAGEYETGWYSVANDLPFIPYHFSEREAGAPIPPLTARQIAAANARQDLPSLADISTQVRAMQAENEVRNLQHQYGYYADRKMWDDVTDLFMPDGVLEIAGLGIYQGVAGIRRALEREGPAGLQYGQVNDRVEFHTIVEVEPEGTVAHTFGLQLGMLTPELGTAYWEVSSFHNTFVSFEGKWRLLEMRVYPQMKADYFKGWHQSSIVESVPAGAARPDLPSSAAMSPQTAKVIPVLPVNPVTGVPPTLPHDFTVTGAKPLTSYPARARKADLVDDANLDEIFRRLAVVAAYDSVENISSAFGYYIDDYQWQRYVANYATDGWRKKANGAIYIGREAIFKAESLSYGPMPVVRDWVRLHNRLQPVIEVASDAKSAYLRTRMLLYFANTRSPGSFNSGMYPNDSAVVEDGVWKMRVGGWIDETYFRSRSYALGWAKPNAPATAEQQGFGIRASAEDKVDQARRGLRYPPDIAPEQLGMRGAGIVSGFPGYADWPAIKPMWFHYVNPVSGRVPEYYCADVTRCAGQP
ncbi:MAG: nuclear transport factor 2 family protein [Gammaproteobacteria bacterium]|nr:nuclear transport factor 2 family protein [Gammaproteobacteria bacterium]